MEKPIVIRRKSLHTITRNGLERDYWEKQLFVCGIDEAGRGPSAGPVVAAAVIVPIGRPSALLKDSKVLSEEARNKAYQWICKHCWVGIGIESPSCIDTHNIYQATLRAMRRAFCQLSSIAPVPISGIIVDAMPLTFATEAYTTIPVHAFIEAESRSCSVAAASIVAKVTRDAMMDKLNPILPTYEFAQHKGYSTAQHLALISTQGRTIVHRNSFLLKIEQNKEYGDVNSQATIWGSHSEQP
jgi:ribonuclease HII